MNQHDQLQQQQAPQTNAETSSLGSAESTEVERIENLVERFLSMPGQDSWGEAEMFNDSPTELESEDRQWQMFLRLFYQNDVIWVGRPFDTGQYEHIRNFRPVEDWLQRTYHPGPCVSAASFHTGTYSRCNDRVRAHRFMVVAANPGSSTDVSYLIRWLKETARLRLAAIVTTGTGRYWGWFHHPGREVVRSLQPIWRSHGCDIGVHNASAAWPMPGCTLFRQSSILSRLAGKLRSSPTASAIKCRC